MFKLRSEPGPNSAWTSLVRQYADDDMTQAQRQTMDQAIDAGK
jgi:hypothetical protein